MARRWKRVRLSIFLCFFLRIRLRRFLIREPMSAQTLAGVVCAHHFGGRPTAGQRVLVPTMRVRFLPPEQL